jgi:hypothetical protein
MMIFSRPKFWIIVLGVIITMSILAAMPPLTESSSTGFKTGSKPTKLTAKTEAYVPSADNLKPDSHQNTPSSPGQPAGSPDQKKTGAEQAAVATLQGSPPVAASQSYTPPTHPLPTPLPEPIVINPPKCSIRGIQPLGVCYHPICPDQVYSGITSCSPCGGIGGPQLYACMLE